MTCAHYIIQHTESLLSWLRNTLGASWIQLISVHREVCYFSIILLFCVLLTAAINCRVLFPFFFQKSKQQVLLTHTFLFSTYSCLNRIMGEAFHFLHFPSRKKKGKNSCGISFFMTTHFQQKKVRMFMSWKRCSVSGLKLMSNPIFGTPPICRITCLNVFTGVAERILWELGVCFGGWEMYTWNNL